MRHTQQNLQGCARASACATVTVTRCVHLIQQRVPYTCADDACPGMPDTSGPLPFSSSHARRVTTNPPPHLPQPPPQPQPAPRGVSPDFGRRPLRGAESCLQLSNGGQALPHTLRRRSPCQGASGGGVCTRAPPRQRLRSSFSSPAHLAPRNVQGSGWAMAGWATARQARVGRGGVGWGGVGCHPTKWDGVGWDCLRSRPSRDMAEMLREGGVCGIMSEGQPFARE